MVPSILFVAAIQAVPGAAIVDRTRIDRAPPTPQHVPHGVTPSPRVASDGAAVSIAGIRFEGAQAPARVAAAAQRFLGKPASRETLQLLAAALSDAYGKSPVALYTVAIPEQDFADGVVRVRLIEGRIARAEVTGAVHAYPLLRARVRPLVSEGPLSRARFERQITLMRAIPGVTPELDFQDPDGTGALTLMVKPKRRHHRFSAGFSNRGVDLLGQGQFDAKAEFYSLATDGDQLSATISAASDLRRYRYGSLAYTAPIGARGWSVTASGAYLETRPRGYPVAGRAKLAGLSILYPLRRDFRHSADISLGIDGLDSENALFGNVITSERTRALRLAAAWSATHERRALALSASVSRGLDLFGARTLASDADVTFLKAGAAIAASQAIGRRVAFRLSASGQYSRDPLPAAERFAIGGEAIGRAFDTGVLTGDRGAGALAELAWRPIRASRLAESELYAFTDGGVIGVVARGPVPGAHYSLASAGVGVRARYRDKAELGLEAARPIDDPYPGYPDAWRVSVAWRLSL